MIDWESLLDYINEKYHKEEKFADLKAMLSYYYTRDGSMRKVSDFLGVSCTILIQKFNKLGIKIKSRGGRNNYIETHPEKFGFKTELEVLRHFRFVRFLTIPEIVKEFEKKGISVTESGIRGKIARARS